MEKKIKDQTVYATSDLALATGLMTLGYAFLRIDGENPNRLFFHFVYDEEIPPLETAFYAGQMSVDAQSFAVNHRRLKTVLFEHKRREDRNGWQNNDRAP